MSHRLATTALGCAIAVLAACSSSSSSKEGKPGASTNNGASSGPSNTANGTGDQPMTSDAKSGITIYGIPLGVPFAAALDTARAADFAVSVDGDTWATATATLHGARVTGELIAHAGTLDDISLRFVLTEQDESLPKSTLLPPLVAELGDPEALMDDLAQWKTKGYEISLQRVFGMAKDSSEGVVEYVFRARPLEASVETPSDTPPKTPPVRGTK